MEAARFEGAAGGLNLAAEALKAIRSRMPSAATRRVFRTNPVRKHLFLLFGMNVGWIEAFCIKLTGFAKNKGKDSGN